MPDKSTKKQIVIVGGSLGGLCAGITLVRLGHDVVIIDRTRAEKLVDQGAGIASFPIVAPIVEQLKNLGTSGGPLVDFLAKYDRTNTLYCTPNPKDMQFLKKDGSVLKSIPIKVAMPFTDNFSGGCSWDVLYNILRANFDGGYDGYVCAAKSEDSDGKATYLSGMSVHEIKGVGAEVEVIHSGGSLKADFVIGADGGSSTVRKLLHPESVRDYAGYVAWRGTVRENELSESTKALTRNNLTVYQAKGTQVIIYEIPGVNGSVKEGGRAVNIVWYCNVEDPKEILTDVNGIEHKFSLGIGKIQPKHKESQKALASSTLPPPVVELWEKVKSPFIQAITDNVATKAAFLGGKVVLLGDALAGFRPHTTAGTAQAALHALMLKEVFEGSLKIDEWEQKVIEFATMSQSIGVNLGKLNQWGNHPLAGDNDPPR